MIILHSVVEKRIKINSNFTNEKLNEKEFIKLKHY